MPAGKRTPLPLTFQPLTPARWADFERLFGANGACGGCWCMYWRLPHARFQAHKGEANRRAMKRLVDSGAVPGLLAYDGDTPAGWCAVAPRADFPRLASSRVLKPVDDTPVWSVPCFFIARAYRRRGLSVALLRAACGHARDRGAPAVEGYPVEPRQDAVPPAFAWTGLASAFVRAGFAECARRSATRPVMRYDLTAARRKQ